MSHGKLLLSFICSVFILGTGLQGMKEALQTKQHTWHDEGQKCICEHMNGIVEKFKGEKDLTMVLGAGSQSRDYTERFPGYTFLVDRGYGGSGGTEAKLKTKADLEKEQTGPLLIPLDFNKKYFFNFLKELKNSFKTIIFDHSVTKYVDWVMSEVKEIFNALQPGGVLYLETGVKGGAYGALEPLEARKESLRYAKKESLFIQQFVIGVGGDGSLKIFPPDEFLRGYECTFLKKVGFEKVELRQKFRYPINYPGLGDIIDYIYAQKPEKETEKK